MKMKCACVVNFNLMLIVDSDLNFFNCVATVIHFNMVDESMLKMIAERA